MGKPRLYIAVEIAERELLAKSLLGCVAAKDGYDVLIGQSHEIRDLIRTWPPGTILWKGMAKKNREIFAFYHKLGHSVISWCEEGFTYADRESYRQMRLSRDTLAELDLFFAWGQHQCDDIEQVAPDLMHKVRIVGNPRMDLLRPEFRDMYRAQIDDIHARFGRYLLVNTNFSAFTGPGGPEALLEKVRATGTFEAPGVEAFFRDRIVHSERMFPSFVEVIKTLAQEFSDLSVIVRPHPAEDMEVWRRSLAGTNGVFIERVGTAVPWMLGSELVVHNDCTTGVEAYLLDKTVISYRPEPGHISEQKLPLAVSHKVKDRKALIQAVSDVLDQNGQSLDPMDGVDLDTLHYFLPPQKGPSATSLLMETLSNIRANTDPDTGIKLKAWIRRKRFRVVELLTRNASRDYPMNIPNEIRRIVQTLSLNKALGLKPIAEPVRATKTCFSIKQASH